MNIKGLKTNSKIVEKKLNIPADYQFKALRSSNFLQSNWHNNKLSVFKNIIRPTKNQTLLDLGTGSGNLEFAFYKQLKKIVGVDYNDEALLFLQKTLKEKGIKNVDLVQADLRSLNKNKSLPKFDLVVMIDVIEHLKIDDVKKLVNFFPKILKPKGKVFIITPNYNSVWPMVEIFLETLHLAPKFTNSQHLSKMNKDVLESVFHANKFKTLKMCSFNLFSFLVPSKNLSGKLCGLELKIPLLPGNLLASVFTKI